MEYDHDLASYTMTPGRRTSYPHHSTLQVEVDPTWSPTYSPHGPRSPLSLAPALDRGASNDSEEEEIQFKTANVVRRTDPQIRTLCAGAAVSPSPRTVSFNAKMPPSYNTAPTDLPMPRKASLVRPEEYMPPVSRSGPNNFNPYFSPSWSRKPSNGLDLDLEGELAYDDADEMSLRQSRFESIALPNYSVTSLGQQPATIPESESEQSTYKSEAGTRTLGGKTLIKSVDWRKKLRLEPHATTTPTDKYTSSPVFAISFREKGHAAFDEKHAQTLQPTRHAGNEPVIVELEEGQAAGRPKFIFLAPFTALLVQGLVLGYLFMRARYLVQASHTTGAIFIGGWLFFIVELIYAVRAGSTMLWQVFGRDFEEYRALRIKGEAWLPTVDVLVICTGQHDQLVMDSAIAAAKLDWPVDKLRVLIIDDSSSHELQRRAESYANSRALHLTYHRRAIRSGVKTAPTSKSALVNFGLTETRLHGRTAADFTLVLDADCIPDPDMLRAMMPYMLQDQQLALVRASQVFYNIPSPMSSTLATFVNAVEPVDFARSGYLMRRCAVDDIGGFPTSSTVEDGQLSALLAGKGYRTRLVRETLQHGLAPDSWTAHLRQGVARNLVKMRTARKMGFYLFGGLRLQHMTFTRRVSNLASSLSPLLSFDICIALVLLPATLLYGDFLVPVINIRHLNTLIRILFATTLADRLHDLVFSMRSGEAGVSRILNRFNFIAPYTLLALGKSLFVGVPAIEAEVEREDGKRERATEASRRLSLLQRLSSVTFGVMGSLVHLGLALAVIGGLVWSVVKVVVPLAAGSRSSRQAGLIVLLTFAWPTAVLLWVNLLKAASVPFAYAFSPPSVAPRDRLLVRDPITNIARPLPDCRRSRPFVETKSWNIAGALLSVIYITVLFALSFGDRLNI